MSTPLTTRPRVFLDVQIGTEPAGRMIIELFSDKTPKTCENFRALCTSSYTPPSASKPLTYKLSPFHRIIDDFMIQGGDITAGDGTGGQSIFGGEFADENIGWRSIDKEGLVCMANRGKGTNSSQFFITLAPCEHLNAKHTLFGHILSGNNVLDRLAKVHVDKSDRPYDAVLISHCGELERPNSYKPTPVPSTRQPMPTPTKPNGSNSRGRNRAKRSRSPTHSPSPTSPHTRHQAQKHHPSTRSRSRSPHHKNKRQARRRSDILVDETRRGRSLTRSQSPASPASKPHRPPSPRHHRRKRSPSRSSSRDRSRSPRLRRRHTRSRSRSRSRSREMEGMERMERMRIRERETERERERESGREMGEERWWDEDVIRREEREREGRGRWDGVIGDEVEGGWENGGSGRMRGYDAGVEGRGGRWGDGRLGGGGGNGNENENGNEGAEVKFKGRGSMKYRERRW